MLPGAGPAAQAAAVRSDAAAQAQAPVLRFIVTSVVFLFVGTVQGVLQTFPVVSQWLRGAGAAGHLIDPLAHAHINLVGGVTMGMMGLFYYVLPRLLERPLHSAALAAVSYWLSTIGVTMFAGSLLVFGLIEGRMVHAGLTYAQALEAVGPVHHLAIVSGATLMGFGYWTFIANVFLSVFTKRGG